jgi:hypothetical protein
VSALPIAKVTVKEAVRSRVLLGLVLGLALVLGLLAAQAAGDGTELGRTRAFLAGALDATWALLALAAVFLSTTSLSRELDDGRAIPILVTPATTLRILVGKWLGLGLVLGGVLAIALVASVALVRVRASAAPAEERDRIEREVLVSRMGERPPRLETQLGAFDTLTLEPGSPSQRALEAAQARLAALARSGELPKDVKPEDALARLLKDEIVRQLTVLPNHRITWLIGPIDPAPGTESVALRYRYHLLESLPLGKGPRGAFEIVAVGQKDALVREVSSTPESFHEILGPPGLLEKPEIHSPVDGRVTAVDETPERRVVVEGTVVPIAPGYDLRVRPGQTVRRGDLLASSDKVWLQVSYDNLDPSVVVVFPPEGVEILHVDRPFLANVVAAFGLVLGRVLFLLAVGLALTTFLDGKVAALAAFFVLLVAASHGYLESAVGPILAAATDNVFGILDVPVKAILRAVLFLLPDLGRYDAGEALAYGRDVRGVLASLGGLALAGGGAALLLGSWILERRELARGSGQ